MRSRTEDPAYNGRVGYTFPELLSAPFDPDCYDDWAVLGFIESIALYRGIEMALADQSNAVWATGRSYIGNVEFPSGREPRSC